jgi:transposase-like protein
VSAKARVFSVEFRAEVARRILNGESISALHRELGIKKSVLYRWREAYQKEGIRGFHLTGRPPGSRTRLRRVPANPEEAAQCKIAELERKIGQQTLDLDFLRKAFKRVRESPQSNIVTGGTASTERSEA